MQRLCNASLATLPADIARPGYDRAEVTPGIVHLGVGAFHRAHQAVAVDDRLAAGEAGWGIVAASLRSPDTRDALGPQDGLYTLAVRDGSGTRLRVIGSILKLVVASEDRAGLIGAMADPRVRIVSLTVTEKGYCHDPATGALNETHPDIVRDLAMPQSPATAPGLIVEALRRRRAAGTPPFTVLCCDNLPANGGAVRKVVSRYAALVEAGLGRFVENEVAFPSTMVDRIVPATTDADRTLVAGRLGVADAWPVMTEPFTQWVIEDAFPQGRPRLELAGAELVADVAPHEKLKLRLLNGSHSTMAYLGQLAGIETISDVLTDTDFARLVRSLMDMETGPTVPGFAPAQVDAYKAALIARFANPALKHRTAQIAMDGSQKLPQRLMETIRERLARSEPIPRLALAVAGYCRFMTGTGETGAALPINDPMAARFATAAKEAGAQGVALAPNTAEAAALAGRLCRAMLAIGEVFGETGRDPRFAVAVEGALARLYAVGARRAVAETA